MEIDAYWLAFIYNLRGEAMTDEVWEEFKKYCEQTGISKYSIPFDVLKAHKSN
jgi:L-rhamnose mutarotase